MLIEDIYFEDIFNLTGDGVYVTDNAGMIILANNALCGMTGYGQEELVGMAGGDLLAPDFSSTFDDFYRRSYGPDQSMFEAEFVRKDGMRMPVELKITNLPQRAEALASGIIVAVRDITERALAERKLKGAHEALRQSRDFFQNVFDMAGDGLYVTDELGCIIMVNRAMCDMTGFSRGEFIGRYGAELLSPDSLPLFEEFFNHPFNDYRKIFEASYYKKDGSQLPVDIRIAPLEGSAGHEAGIIVSVRDVTERKKAEHALGKARDELQQSRDFFQNVFDMAGDGIHVTDEMGTVIYANQAMCDMLGYGPEELLGRPAIDLTADLSGAGIDEAMLQEMYSRDYSSYFEVLYQRKDGTVLPVEAKVTNVLYGNEPGPALIISVRDTTERKRAEEALKKAHQELQRSRDFFHNVFNLAGDGIYVTDDLGLITFANKALCDMLDYEPDELAGRPAVDLTPELAQEGAHEKMVREMYAMDYSNFFECLYQRKDGSILPVEAKVTNVRYGSQDSPALIICLRDITERKRFELEIKEANTELESKVEERTRSIEEVNTALRVLLKSRDEDRLALEEKMVSNVRELILPYMEKLKKFNMDEIQKVYFDIIENNLNEIISPFLKKIKYFNLTPTEIQVANFIKHGKNTKEIAELLNLSPRTVEGHRDSIRKKLNLNKNKANLRTHLSSLD